MSVQSRQALRMIKFVAELKKNNYPNAGSFAKLLRKADGDENFAFACSTRTIMRDIETLQNDYHAPIAYDALRRGYYLKSSDWEFNCPVMDDDIFSMTLLGTRLASDILPQPIKGKLDHAMEKSLTGNSSEFFDQAMIESLLCASGIKAAIEPEIFKTVFDAWRIHQVLNITYQSPNTEPSERKFEPHIIVFHKGLWYTKGFEARTKNIKVYAIQRIQKAAFAGATFPINKQLLEDTHKNGLFDYEKIDNIKLRCDASIAFYLQEHQKIKQFKIECQPDNSLLIYLRPAIEHEVIRWVLGESGKIEVLEPLALRKKVADAAKLVYEKNKL